MASAVFSAYMCVWMRVWMRAVYTHPAVNGHTPVEATAPKQVSASPVARCCVYQCGFWWLHKARVALGVPYHWLAVLQIHPPVPYQFCALSFGTKYTCLDVSVCPHDVGVIITWRLVSGQLWLECVVWSWFLFLWFWILGALNSCHGTPQGTDVPFCQIVETDIPRSEIWYMLVCAHAEFICLWP